MRRSVGVCCRPEGRGLAGRLPFLDQDGQAHDELTAPAKPFAECLHRPAVHLDQAFHQGEADA
jgi:hypothetical protein